MSWRLRAVSDSSAAIARNLHIDGMHHHWSHLAASVIALPIGQGVVMTFLDRSGHGLSQRSMWLEPVNDKS